MSSIQTNNEPVWIIDCAPGCDDAIALCLAAQELGGRKVTVLAVAGNVGVELTTWNACRVMAACNMSWPVHRGCSRSLSGEAVSAASVHGRDGLGDIPNDLLPGAIIPPEQPSAVEVLLKRAKESERFVLVCTGPLTNLASAINLMSSSEQRTFWSNCVHCVVMGGAFEVPGNITAGAEFNVHFDPVAFHMVLESWREAAEGMRDPRPIHMVPLDVTETVGIPLLFMQPKEGAPKLRSDTTFLRAALRKYGLFHAWYCRRPRVGCEAKPRFNISNFDENAFLDKRMAGENGQEQLHPFCYLHDPLAVWMALRLANGQDDDRLWAKWHISVDMNSGPGRGRIFRHRHPSPRDNPSRLPVMGTTVKWLHPRLFARHSEEFVKRIGSVLEISPQESKHVTL